MKIFLTTSHNQVSQVSDLFSEIQQNYDDLLKFIIVESGNGNHNKVIREEKVELIKTDSDSFWAKSNAIGLNYIYSNFEDDTFDLIILNCDVRLNEWVRLENNFKLRTFYTVDKGIIARSGFCVTNWLAARHKYPFLEKPYDEALTSQVDIVPTRFIFISGSVLKTIWGMIPNYTKLPHYTSDLEFTYRISKYCNEKWLVDKTTFIEEDYTTSGIKNVSGSISERLKVISQRKSVYNIRDRFWYSYLLTKNKTLIIKMGYISSSIMKLFIQVLRP